MCFRRKVKVNVCYVSNMLPNEYCPSTVVRQYYKGQEPTTVCTIHHAPIPPDPPEPPTIKKCDIPYYKTGKLLCVADACLCLLSTKDSETFKMADIPAYLDALVADGVNALRSVCEFGDETPGKWESWKVEEYGYYDHIRQILAWIKERELTLILCVQPYGNRSVMSTAHYQGLINQALEFAPYVIVEMENEPQDNTINKFVGNLAISMGVPKNMLQIEYVDSGEWYDYITGTLESKANICLHFYASLDTITAPWPKGWTTSDGTMKLVHEQGMYPSSDGGTDGHNGQFPWWGGTPYHTSNSDDCYEMTRWNLSEGGRGFEFLSPQMFDTDYPNVALATIPYSCRKAMRKAYDEIIHA